MEDKYFTILWLFLPHVSMSPPQVYMCPLHSEKVSAAQSCPTLCDPVDCSPPGSPVRGILQQEHWSVLPCPSRPRLLQAVFTVWATSPLLLSSYGLGISQCSSSCLLLTQWLLFNFCIVFALWFQYTFIMVCFYKTLYHCTYRNAAKIHFHLSFSFIWILASITSDTQMTPPLWQKVKKN